VPRNLYNYFYYYAVRVHTHLSPRSDTINFDTVKSAQFYFSVIRNRQGLYCSFFVRDKLYGHIFVVSRNICSAFILQVLLPLLFVTPFLLVKCMSLFQIAVVVWQLLHLRRILCTRCLFFFLKTQCIWHFLNIRISIKVNTKNRH